MRALLCAVLVAAACGSHPSIDDFYKEQIQINCEFEVKCCTATSDVTYTSVEACETANDDSAELAMAKAAIAAGTIAYDSGAAGSCIDEYRSLYGGSCSKKVSTSEENIFSSCENVIHGTAKVGATCDDMADFGACEIGSDCISTEESGAGTCVAWSKAGADCSQTFDCVSGYYCDEGTMVCFKVKADGATCDDDEECESVSCPNGTCMELDEVITDSCETPDVLKTSRHLFSSRAASAPRHPKRLSTLAQ